MKKEEIRIARKMTERARNVTEWKRACRYLVYAYSGEALFYVDTRCLRRKKDLKVYTEPYLGKKGIYVLVEHVYYDSLGEMYSVYEDILI